MKKDIRQKTKKKFLGQQKEKAKLGCHSFCNITPLNIKFLTNLSIDY